MRSSILSPLYLFRAQCLPVGNSEAHSDPGRYQCLLSPITYDFTNAPEEMIQALQVKHLMDGVTAIAWQDIQSGNSSPQVTIITRYRTVHQMINGS